MAWKDPKTLNAVAQWMRLVVGLVLVVLLIWMFANARIDLETVVKALVGLLAVDKIGMAIASRPNNT